MLKAPPERSRANVLSVPSGVPFLEIIADDLLDGGLLPGVSLRHDPLGLSDAAIYLPTRRAVRELEAIFARKLGGAALLPRIAALGDFDEDEDVFDRASRDGEAVGLPREIGETERRLVLARLIRRWAEALRNAKTDPAEADLISTSPAEAMSLAIELGGLIDSFETEGVPWTKLVGLVPPEHDRIWELTTTFLSISAEAWPQHLKENGKIGEAERRNKQLHALATRIQERPPSSPIIIAGSTGSNPATAELMAAVARLPLGAVVLHGLDVRADATVWAAIGGERHDGPVSASAWTHPQHGFFRLLKKLDVQLGEVGLLGKEDTTRDARRRLVASALLPSELTDTWSSAPMTKTAGALAGVTLIEAANEREEALAIALALRETLEQPDRTAALITPDRPLARRVVAELKRWNIEAEDSAGLPLADSETGIFARLIAEAAASNLRPDGLLPLLRHPLASLGLDDDVRDRASATLEIAILRGAAPPPGIAGLKRALELASSTPNGETWRWHPAKRRLQSEDWKAASALLNHLGAALEPLCAFGAGGYQAPLFDLLAAHRVAIIATEAGTGSSTDPDHKALGEFFEEALTDAAKGMKIRLIDYPAIFKTMLRGRTSRSRRPSHPRLRILGTLEARLLGFDRVVLGGLNEGTWPPQTQNDAFLSRPMRAALGLPPPEWRIGLSAHDFEQALGGNDVVLTRAVKSGGAPSVAARWLQRLAAVSGTDWKPVKARGEVYLAWSRALDEATTVRLPPPEPRPPRTRRPNRLSVTEIETLIRDPYAIYARHVLGLRPLDPVGAAPEASDRGTIIHDALARFVAEEDVFAAEAVDRLTALGREAFEEFWDFPDVRALWWPRFQRIARWFVGWERERRSFTCSRYLERAGKLEWRTAGDRIFTLSGRADRFDVLTDGGLSVLDYKTGAAPTGKQVLSGLAPQLPLEAAMLAAGGFKDTPPGEASEFLYVRLSGQVEPGEEKAIDLKGKTAAEVATAALAELKLLIDRFEDEGQPYRSGTHPQFRRRPNGDYDHLARIAEWSLGPETEDPTE